MSDPIVEKIALKIAARLETVKEAEDYAIEVTELVRPARRPKHSPHHGVTILRLEGFEAGEGGEIGQGGSLVLERTALWAIDYALEPADADTTPIDKLAAVAIAELERALAEDFYLDAADTFAGPGGFAGLGHNAELRPPQILMDEDGATAGVRVNLAVSYRHTDRDPYTAQG